MAPVTEVRGAKELRKTMKAAGESLKDLSAIHKRVGTIVAEASRPRSPAVSGRLAGSVRPSSAATRATIRAGSAAVPYAGPIHFGWPARNIAANPFITSAAEATEPEWTEAYVDGVDDILGRVRGA